ncbi:MAG: Shikimate kinase [Alphaproteobacteria bacterium ADurb.Bin438]|nr:MAG: Shikimate kinase [Alphaproteobacteria bacterium ADurb.Bin438]
MQVKTKKINKSIMLVGLMGCGKTSVGMLLSKHYKMPFFDSDVEIEKASNISISDFFANYGEAEFRKGEEKIISRLLNDEPSVIATGGGAFISENTRSMANENALTIWINADVEVLYERTSKSDRRPLLKNTDIRAKLTNLLNERQKFYSQAKIVVPTYKETARSTSRRVIKAIDEYLKQSED